MGVEVTPAVSNPTQLAPVERYALVPTNPVVMAVSATFGWKAETAIARIERALPNKFEQQVYLAVAEGSRKWLWK